MWQAMRWLSAIGTPLAVAAMLAAAEPAPKALTPQQQAEARLAMAETCLAEKDYAAAREACAQVQTASCDARWIAQAQMVLARSYLQQRNYPIARQELRKLLAMEGLERQLRWEAEALLDATALVVRVRTDHPRLFFNAETWPAIKARALTVERVSFDRMKAQVDRIPLEEIRPGDWAMSEGVGVMEAAFVYRVTGDPAVLEKVRRMLRETAEDVFPKGREHGERSRPNIAWLAALDWVWNDLVPPEREALADAMLRYASERLAESRVQKGGLETWPHYYVGNMYGFAGLALLDPSADDVAYARALSLLGIGWKHYQERFAALLGTAGEDGVWQTNVEYDLVEVPVPVFAFLYAWQPATGSELPSRWATVGISPHFALRMAIGMGKNHFRHFNYAGHSNGAWGFGQVYSSALYDHLGHFMHFFGRSHAQEAAIAHYLRRRMVETGAGPADGQYPVFRFLMTDFEKAPPPVLPARLPLARYFASVGLVLMSSGFGPDDTYALFSQGGGVAGRRHDFDATHFSLYKKGYLALDTGARFALPHSPNYRHQTVAHNCVLIHMPGERFPASATGPVMANTAGQNRWPQDARPLAFETGPHYAYTAVDATPVYHADKCSQMVRQFIYLPPDHFVVFDRVTSQHAEYAKTWLLHTANEPVIVGKEFRADQDQGRIFCRTLYPLDAVPEKIGGPGKEFWADGRNWAIIDRFQSPGSGDWWKHYGHGYTEPPEAMGRWRVEVKPAMARADDVFLHLIQVSGLTDEKMVASQVREQSGRIELTFTFQARTSTIALNTTGDIGGHIRIAEGNTLVTDRDLSREIMPQSGLALMSDTIGLPATAAGCEDHRDAATGCNDVEALLQQLTAETRSTLDEDARSVAAIELVGIGKPATEQLIAALANPAPEVRRRAAWALGEIRDPAAAAALVKTLHDQDGFTRTAACDALSKMGQPAVDGLIAALDSREAGMRLVAARGLARIGDARAAERLAVAVGDVDPAVCREAIRALGTIKDRVGVPVLIDALGNDDPRTRAMAAWALGATGQPAIGPLIAALADENAQTGDLAVQSLKMIGKPAAAPLMAALKDPRRLVRANAAQVLGMIDPPDAAPALLPLLKDADSQVRSRAAGALGKLADARAQEPLLAALKDADGEVRCSAAEGLGRMKDLFAVEPLISTLRDESPLVRRAAVDALGELGDHRAVVPVIAALNDADRLVRLAAARTLGRIKDPRAIEPLIEAVGDDYNAVGYEANRSLYAMTGHKLDIPMGWNSRTLRTYRLPLWRKWWESETVGNQPPALRER
ncbi:MAG: HEAT repeat domain-containing protein [Pirellulales bacterium]|nr:HEAT repeat domain-containing protein [Pirellulales bacterium]